MRVKQMKTEDKLAKGRETRRDKKTKERKEI